MPDPLRSQAKDRERRGHDTATCATRSVRSPTAWTMRGCCAPARRSSADSLYAIASESTYLRMTDGAGLSPDE